MAKSRLTRSTQLAHREEVREQLLKVFEGIERGYREQVDRSDDVLDYWDIYNCRLTSKQFYAGNSRLFVPLVHNAVEARKTRFMGQLFPQAGRSVDVTTEDGEVPHAEMALLEMYCDKAELRTKLVPAMLVAGDVEGQYTVCVTWSTRKRHVVTRQTSPVKIGGIEHEGLGEIEKLVEETIEDSWPQVDIVPDPDFLVLPATSDTIDEALDAGGSVTALCRWSKARVEQAIADGEIDLGEGEKYTAAMLMEQKRGDEGQTRNVPKKLADAAGIKAGGQAALIYRTFTRIEIAGERRLVLAYYGGDDVILGCKLCPYWNDKADYITASVRKTPGVLKGQSQVKPCADMQYFANDVTNEGADSATYGLLPIIMTDPQKNPKYATMVADMMAVWETSPNDTKVLQFPPLYENAFSIVAAAERYINMTLGVNPAMLPQSTGSPKTKRNQAEVALEQQVDILSTDQACVVIEGVLSEVLERFAEYDAQFRDSEATVRSIGPLGVKAEMVTVPAGQMGKRWRYKWRGTSTKNTVQQIQQQISALNVIKGMSQDPQVAQAGYRVNPVPLMKTVADNAFGPDLAPQIFVSMQDELSFEPELENEMLGEGFQVPVSPLDNDATHLQAHVAYMQQHRDMLLPHTPQAIAFQLHISAHQKQMQAKQQAQTMRTMMQQQQQRPAAAAPGPRPGATPAPPRGNVQQPPGRIAPDQMRGGLVQMPRRTG